MDIWEVSVCYLPSSEIKQSLMHILHIARAKCWLLKIQRVPESGGWHTDIKIVSVLWCSASSPQFFHHRYWCIHFWERWRHGNACRLLLIPLTAGWPGTSQPSAMGSFPVFWLCWHCLFSCAEAHSFTASKELEWKPRAGRGIGGTDGIFQVDQWITGSTET